MQPHEFRELIERVKLRSPIEVIVAERVRDLQKRGATWKARCPFHNEKTPSFVVNPERGTWHCFGACDEGGDVIKFVERFEGLTFLDAVRLLAQGAGEPLPEDFGRRGAGGRGGDGEELRERMLEGLARAERLYARRLFTPEGDEALRYVRERGFDDETLDAFGIGFAPASGNPLLDAAREVGFPEGVLVEAGLVRRTEADGRAYDFFRGRMMIPIRDLLGRPVGFGGRKLPGDERPGGKYINTAETPLFKKSRLIYGIDVARAEVRRTKELILMEGYTDVMAAHQVGIKNAAAVLGTATTADHAAVVRRTGAERITLVFDGDQAGDRASLKALAELLPLGVELRVLVPPAGKDPCDLCLEDAGATFRALVEAAPDWFAHALDGMRGLPGPRLAAAVDEVLLLLEKLPRPVERDVRLAEMARALDLPEEGIRQQAALLRRKRRPADPEAAVADRYAGAGGSSEGEEPTEPADARLAVAFRALIGAALLDNSLIPGMKRHREICPEGDLRELSRVILELFEGGDDTDPVDAGAVLTALADHPARNLVVPLVEEARRAESPQVLARDQLAWLDRRAQERQVQSHRKTLNRQASLDDDSILDALRGLHTDLRQLKVPGASIHEPHTT